MSAQFLPDRQLQALWKAMDTDRSGDISVTEFMVFMRRHSQSQVASRSVVDRAKTDVVKKLSQEETQLLRERFSSESVESIKRSVHHSAQVWDGKVSEWDFHHVVRSLLHISEEAIHD